MDPIIVVLIIFGIILLIALIISFLRSLDRESVIIERLGYKTWETPIHWLYLSNR